MSASLPPSESLSLLGLHLQSTWATGLRLGCSVHHGTFQLLTLSRELKSKETFYKSGVSQGAKSPSSFPPGGFVFIVEARVNIPQSSFYSSFTLLHSPAHPLSSSPLSLNPPQQWSHSSGFHIYP